MPSLQHFAETYAQLGQSLRRCSEDERAFWRRTLQDAEPSEGDLEQAIAYVRRSGAIDDTIKRARHYGAMACDALAIFPDSREKSALLDAVEFCISRLH